MKKGFAAVAMLLFAASVAVAQEGHQGEHRQGPPPGFVAMFGEPLALTDAQKTDIGNVEKKTREDNAAFFASSRELMDQMRAAREANDQAKIDALKPKVDANREEMKKIRQAELGRILPLLTADQKEKFETLRKEREAQRREHADQH
jgi:Spy/CpxP family protein refolding chaperone